MIEPKKRKVVQIPLYNGGVGELNIHPAFVNNGKFHDIEVKAPRVYKDPSLWERLKRTYAAGLKTIDRRWDNFWNGDRQPEITKKQSLVTERNPARPFINLDKEVMIEVRPETDSVKAAYFNDFAENRGNSVRTAKAYREAKGDDRFVGDKWLPLERFSTFQGIEDGKFKTGPLEIFRDDTRVFPNRHKNTGLINEIRYHSGYGQHGDAVRKEISELQDSIKSEKSDAVFGEAYTNDKIGRFQNRINGLQRILDDREVGWFGHGVDGSVNPLRTTTGKKFVLGSPTGSGSVFIGNMSDLDAIDIDSINGIIKNGVYPVMTDNGRYDHFIRSGATYEDYVSGDTYRNPNSMYIVGSKKRK